MLFILIINEITLLEFLYVQTVLDMSSVNTNEERATVNGTSQGFGVSIHSMGKLWFSALTNEDLRSNTEPYAMPSFKVA